MINLLLQELKIQRKVNNLTKYSVLFFLFSIVCLALVSSSDEIQKYGILFSLLCIPLSALSISNNLFKNDIDDGTLEIQLTTAPSWKIVYAKYGALAIIQILSFAIISPFLALIFNIDPLQTILLFVTASILIKSNSALVTLISSIQAYFRSNTSFLAVLIIPVILPNIILSGMFIQNFEHYYILFIMIGISMIIIPASLFLSSYLIDNIYNI